MHKFCSLFFSWLFNIKILIKSWYWGIEWQLYFLVKMWSLVPKIGVLGSWDPKIGKRIREVGSYNEKGGAYGCTAVATRRANPLLLMIFSNSPLCIPPSSILLSISPSPSPSLLVNLCSNSTIYIHGGKPHLFSGLVCVLIFVFVYVHWIVDWIWKCWCFWFLWMSVCYNWA